MENTEAQDGAISIGDACRMVLQRPEFASVAGAGAVDREQAVKAIEAGEGSHYAAHPESRSLAGNMRLSSGLPRNT